MPWEEAPDWRLVERAGVRVMLGHCPRGVPPSELGSHNWFGYLDVDDVDAPHDEIVVTTVDGHRIVFGQERARSRQAGEV